MSLRTQWDRSLNTYLILLHGEVIGHLTSQEIAEYLNDYDNLVNAKETIEDLKNDVEDAEEYSEDLQERINELESSEESLRDERDTALSNMEGLQEEYDHQIEEIHDLQEERDGLQTENKLLKLQLEDAFAHILRLEERIAESEASL